MMIPSSRRWDYRQNHHRDGAPPVRIAVAESVPFEIPVFKLILHILSSRDEGAVAQNMGNRTTEERAATLAVLTGGPKLQAVTRALRDRVVKGRRRRADRALSAELDEIARHCASLPTVDSREPEDILGYDEHGLPT